MSDLCTCGDALKDHQGQTGGCIYCACSVFDPMPQAAPPDPPAKPEVHDCGPRCHHRAGVGGQR